MSERALVSLKEIIYWKTVDLWKRFYSSHAQLLDQTFQEYNYLLSSDIENIEKCLQKKNETMKMIDYLEEIRRGIMRELNEISREKVRNSQDLTRLMNELEIEKKQKKLLELNQDLRELIKKIQSQNKKNRIFINKVLHSLKFIKEAVLGKKSNRAYDSKGCLIG